MMAHLVSLPVEAGREDILVFEVEPEVSEGLVLASPVAGQITARAEVTLEQAIEKLKPSLQKLVRLLKELAPDEAAVDFGLKIGGETGVIVARGTAEVNFAIHISWRAQAG
jgi:NTP-dependent ternary system trypsin peptidase co-occuring protein